MRYLPRMFGGLLLTSCLAACAAAEQPAADRRSVDLLVRGATVATMDPDFTVHSPGFVAVSGDSIVEVGPADQADRFQAPREIAVPGGLVLPGLVNGHQHAPMVLFRGLADDQTLMGWLENYIFPAEAENVDPDFVYWGTMLSAVEMVQTGTTTYADMYYFEDKVAEATSRVGMRGVLGQTIIGFPAPDFQTPEETLDATEGYLQRWRDHPRVIPAVAPHAPYTCSREVLTASKALADRYDSPLLIHLAETEDEVREVREKTGWTPVRYLAEIGFLSDRVTAAHVVWADAEEIELLKRFNVGVIHNPESNMKLASGVAPIPEMLAAGIDVGLGTDGAASNNNLDMLQEVDSMAKLHKLFRRDPTVVSARQALRAATLGSARALGLGDRLGSLEAGKKADLIVLGRRSAGAWPSYDPHSQAVYSLLGGSVDTVVVGGRVVMRGGRFPDLPMAELLSRVEGYQRQIQASVRSPKGSDARPQ